LSERISDDEVGEDSKSFDDSNATGNKAIMDFANEIQNLESRRERASSLYPIREETETPRVKWNQLVSTEVNIPEWIDSEEKVNS
jgi:hypothetical protein